MNTCKNPRSIVSLSAALVFCLAATGASWPASALNSPGVGAYREPWRPQFHFTPALNWMNDPNGMVYFDGEYHLFYQYNPFGDKWGHMSWGHAVSRDLVQWEHLPLALAEENGVMIFSGSAVVDWSNSSGFGQNGKPPLVAIYTGHHTTKPLQNQHIAYSNDRGRSWTKYSGNPVLDIGEADFRDPKVFWHEATRRWVMAVSWPMPRKVRFYASTNLKDWTHLSDFGPAGSVKGIWECPDLFPVTVEKAPGRPAREKWVLVVNVGSGAPAGGSGCQYFVGEFDGRQFALDPSYPKPEPEFVPPGRVLADFDGGNYGGWRPDGEAFGVAPAPGKIGDQQVVTGFRGAGLVNSFNGGDAAQGTLTSPEFEVTANHLSFLIGGGNHAEATAFNLLVEGRVVRTATGDNTERLDWKSWDVREFRGRPAVLQVLDRHGGGWGHVSVDQVLLADVPARPAAAAALWADWGRDFYAAVSWSDVPKRDGRRLWLGWMSNWEYAGDVPTAPWRSAMSVPRSLTLRETADGFRLVQQPVRELTKLRGSRHRLGSSTFDTARTWLARQRYATDRLEIRLEVEGVPAGGVFGLALHGAGSEVTLIRCDAGSGTVQFDRSRSGKTDFHRAFPAVQSGPLKVRGGRVTLQILVDTSSVEVFANEGETVLTELILPTERLNRLEFTPGDGPAPARVRSLDIWELNSAWR